MHLKLAGYLCVSGSYMGPTGEGYQWRRKERKIVTKTLKQKALFLSCFVFTQAYVIH